MKRVLKRVPGVVRGQRALRARFVVARKRPQELWSKALPAEVDFWEKELPDRVATWPDYKLRADPEAPVCDPILKMLIAKIPETTVSMIDVGAGPLTALGKTYPGKTLKVTATDPLASEYLRIMRETAIEPPVPPVACNAEDLLDLFEPYTFDLAFARNALDHSFDPVRAITNMVDLVKEGRFVLLRHLQREGERNCYRNLHQWNFDLEDGDFVIWRPRTPKIRMQRLLADSASLTCFQEAGWIVCLITKRRSTRSSARI